MRISDLIAGMIQQMISEAEDGIAEIQRNELANRIGCVPSQINYVITSRFTPEQGYIVESRRGGGGYIRITRVNLSRNELLRHIINNIGARLSCECARNTLATLVESDIISGESALLTSAAMADVAYHDLPQELRDLLRAAIFKQMLATLLK